MWAHAAFARLQLLRPDPERPSTPLCLELDVAQHIELAFTPRHCPTYHQHLPRPSPAAVRNSREIRERANMLSITTSSPSF